MMIRFFSLYRREVARFSKVLIQTVVTPIVSSCLYLFVFGVSLGNYVLPHQGVSYLAFIIPGLVMMGVMNNAFQNSSSSIVSAKFTGELEDLRVVPLSNHEIIWAMSFAAVVRGFVVGTITYLVGSVFFYLENDTPLAIAHPWYLFFFMFVGGLSFGKMGLSTAFWARSFDQLSAVSTFVLLPLTYLGGVFFSVENLTPFWQSIARANPLLYFINGIRYGILGVSDVDVGLATWVSVLALLFFHLVAQLSLKKGSFHRW